MRYRNLSITIIYDLQHLGEYGFRETACFPCLTKLPVLFQFFFELKYFVEPRLAVNNDNVINIKEPKVSILFL